MRLLKHDGRRYGWTLSVELERRDLFVGLYWRRASTGLVHVRACLVPGIPLHLIVGRGDAVTAAMVKKVSAVAPSRQARRARVRDFLKGRRGQ
jgi:hypothetical protein